MKHKFITIEGVEGAGKSTVLSVIRNYFSNANISHTVTREPGGTEIAEKIRNIILYPQTLETLLKETELLLMFSARAQVLEGIIKPALARGDWVISDRYVDASYAYQGGGRSIDLQYIQMLDAFIVNDFYPSLTLFLDLPVELGLRRTKDRKQSPDRIEHEKVDFFERVRSTYLKRAEDDPKRFKIIDASKAIQQVENEIIATIEHFLINFADES